MHGFIIRPFGSTRDIDVEAVERDLIAPSRLDITGRTTAVIARAGSIRADMFHHLLLTSSWRTSRFTMRTPSTKWASATLSGTTGRSSPRGGL